MVDSSDFEAFYRQEREKASRILPPSSHYVGNVAPSRHLFFAREQEFGQESSPSEMEKESESTLQGETVFAQPIPFLNSRGSNEVIETFRKNSAQQHSEEGPRGVNSTQRKHDHTGSKSTFFESPYWPG